MDGINGIGPLKGISTLQQFRYMLQAVQDVRTGKVAREDAVEQTILRYRLDADERGVLKSASPADSQRAVTNQEQTNVQRLSAEARARGEDVVGVDVDYKTAIVDGKLAIVAGRTEVVSKPGGESINDGSDLYVSSQAPDESNTDEQADPSAEYLRIGFANRDAAASGLLIDLADDGTLRGLTGGLEPD